MAADRVLVNPRITSPRYNGANNLVNLSRGPVTVDDSVPMRWMISAWLLMPVTNVGDPYRIEGVKSGQPVDLQECVLDGGNGVQQIAVFAETFESPAGTADDAGSGPAGAASEDA
jgi:hypothetical protein